MNSRQRRINRRHYERVFDDGAAAGQLRVCRELDVVVPTGWTPIEAIKCTVRGLADRWNAAEGRNRFLQRTLDETTRERDDLKRRIDTAENDARKFAEHARRHGQELPEAIVALRHISQAVLGRDLLKPAPTVAEINEVRQAILDALAGTGATA